MKNESAIHLKWDKLTGFTVVLGLHLLALYGLMSYQIIPPPSEALTVFVNCINPPSPAKVAAPAAPKPVRQEAPPAIAPAVPQVLTSPAPVTSPGEPVAPPPPVAKTIPAPSSSPVVSGSAAVPVVAAAPQTVQMSSELSVSCQDRPPPSYPKQSLRLGEQGKTVLQVELDELGRVANVVVKTTSGFARLDEAAVNTVKNWRCTPAKRNGVAVRSVALQPFNFALKGR